MIRVVDATQRPGIVLMAVALATLLLGGGLARLSVDTSIETMIVDGDADRRAFEERKQIFGNDEVVAIAIPFDDALSREALAAQRAITERLSGLAGVRDVDSLANSSDIVGDGDVLRVDPLLPKDADPAALAPEELARVRARVEANEIWTGFLISRDRKTAAIAVHLEDDAASGSDRVALMAALDRTLLEELGDRPFYLAGHPFMKTEIGRTIQRDLAIFMPVTLVVMMLFLRMGTRSWRASAAILGTAVVSVLWMLGAMGWIGEPLTAVSSTAPTILLALATAYLMHFAAAFQRKLDEGLPSAQASAAAFEEYAMPVAIASATTAIGFISLTFSSVPIVRGFGIDLALGMASIVVLGLVAMPALFALAPIGERGSVFATSSHWARVLGAISNVSLRWPWPVIAVAIVASLAAGLSATRIEVDSSGPKKFAKDSRFRVSSEFYRQNLSGDVVENVYLFAEPGGFYEPERLRRVRALQREMEALPEIDATLSIADHIALMNRAVHGDDPREERIPETRGAVAQYLLLHSASGDPEAFDDLVAPDYDEARIIARATVLSSHESAALRKKLQALVERFFPESVGHESVLSTEILLSRAADALSREQLRGFSGAILAILAAVVIGFRSLKAGALMVLPNGLPILMNLGVMGALGIPLNDTTSLISAIALGVGVDSTVHLLASVNRAEAENRTRRGSVLRAMLSVGRPIVLTSVVVIAGFAVLLLSDFRGIVEMGGLMAFTMLLCLLMDLFVTPAQLVAWSGAEAGVPALVHAPGQAIAAMIEEREASGGVKLRLLDPMPDGIVEVETLGSGVRALGRLEAVDGSGLSGFSPSSASPGFEDEASLGSRLDA